MCFLINGQVNGQKHGRVSGYLPLELALRERVGVAARDEHLGCSLFYSESCLRGGL